MKRNIGLKILTILIIITICLISFIGIYKKDKAQMVSILPEYKLSMNLTGSRTARLVNDATKEVIYDKDGNVASDGINDDGTLKEGYTKKNEKVNSDEVLTKENYELSKEIIEKRLKANGVSDYILKQNTEDGSIIIEMPEDENTDNLMTDLTYLGKFEIIDSDTKEVLIDNNGIKRARAVYSDGNSGTTVYLSIEFNKEGTKKFEEITKTYTSSVNDEGTTVTKKVTLNLDDQALTETYFSQAITDGILQLSIGSVSTDSKTISDYIRQASEVAALIDSGKMPIQYNLESNIYLSTDINKQVCEVIMYTLITVIAIALIYLCIKYKANGIALSISYIGYIALVLLTLRYTNVPIAFETIVVAIVLLVVNYMFIKSILTKQQKEQNINEILKQTYIKYTSIVLPLLIIGVVFAFINWTVISSMGMVMFWGLIIMFIYNYITTKCLLSDRK